ncbi:MAG: hypothetical protein ABI831_13170 [Betaproteobacteria bacterium]
MTYRVLMLGASYGSLLASKMLLAGHSVSMVCLPAEAELMNEEGFRVRFPARGNGEFLEVDSRRLPGILTTGGPQAFDPAGYDLVGLAMQEPQYRSPGVRELLDAVAEAKTPCMSIMNMPPLTYLSRLPGVSASDHRHCYTDPTVWDGFDPAYLTLCSPDPQAFRPPDEKINVLQVGLPTNFKAARFASDAHTAILRQLQADIETARFDSGHGRVELPVKLKVHDSVFVPLAKWSMLVTGNYRCIRPNSVCSIKESVHADIDQSRSIYEWVESLCSAMGATAEDRVPFEKYANAASSLGRPSSAARAVANGAQYIERVDRLVQSVASRKGMRSDALDEIVATVDARIDANRRADPQ